MSSGYVFDRYQRYDGKWRWSLNAPGGRVIAESGESYKTRSACDRAIEKIKREAPGAEKVLTS